VVVGDALSFLLEHYKEFDIIWVSPECPTHSDIRRVGVHGGIHDAVLPNMDLYQIIIFLTHFFQGKWIVENVKPYYEYLIKPRVGLYLLEMGINAITGVSAKASKSFTPCLFGGIVRD